MFIYSNFSYLSNDQTDSDFLIKAVITQFLNQKFSLDSFYEQKSSDAEKFRTEVINVFTQTEIDNSSETVIPTKNTFLAPLGYFSNP